MRSMTRRVAIVLLAAATVGASGCAKKWQTGAVVGAGGGAVAGAAVGQVAGSTTKGAIIGAVVGGVAGGLIGNEMDKRAAELRQNIRGAKVERVGEGIQVTFDSGLMFDVDSDDLRAEARTNLGELAKSFDKYEDSDIMIVGHTDNTGTEAHNQDLSIRRADAAAGFLVDRGVSGKRIRTLGLGEMEPVSSNETASGRQENRRIEVAIYASKDMQEAAKKKAAGG
jgi:outer membrane protein OmpA-like peptidoglycan-associated protein